MMMRQLLSTTLVLTGVLLAGCRGMETQEPPIHLNLNMDFQERFNAQEANPFFADNRAMRPTVPGTVARGLLREDTEFYLGRTATGAYVPEMPVPITRAFVERGQERYNIYCAVCHGAAGDGLGIIMVGNSGQGYGYTPAPSYHTTELRSAADGYLYDVIANGVRSMPAYGQQIAIADRWAIVAYLRALQRSQYAGAEDVPESLRSGLRAAPDAGEEEVGAEGEQATTPQEPTTPSTPGQQPAPGSAADTNSPADTTDD